MKQPSVRDCRPDLRRLARKSAVGLFAADPARLHAPAAGSPLIEPHGLELIGSGFFVTGDLVLTCAHVLRDVSAPYVLHGGIYWPAEILTREPDYRGRGSWPPPDIALLRVRPSSRAAERSPVWLAVRPAAQANHDGNFFNCGYDKAGPGAVPSLSDRIYTGAGSRAGWQIPGMPEIDYTDLRDDTVPRFRSGSMVIDMETGRVAGIMKAAREGQDGMGGYVVPLAEVLGPALGGKVLSEILAANDLYHAQHRTWPEMCAKWFSKHDSDMLRDHPLREAALLGLLAQVRDTVGTPDLDSLPRVRDDQRIAPDASLRDVSLLLAETTTPSATAVHSLLEFMDGLVRQLPGRTSSRWRSDAMAWIDGFAAELGQTARLQAQRTRARNRAEYVTTDQSTGERTVETGTTLQVLVDPAMSPLGGYHVTIRRFYGPDRPGADAVPASDVDNKSLTRYLSTHLPAVAEQAATIGGPSLLDVIVPQHLLDLPVHSWSNGHGTPVGRLMPVAMRPLERYREDNDVPRRDLLQKAWKAHSAEVVALDWTLCTDINTLGFTPLGRDSADSLLRPVDAADSAPPMTNGRGMTNPPSDGHPALRELLSAAVDEGVPLMVWSASGCGVTHASGRPVQQCGGPFFRTSTDDVLAGVVLSDVPRQLFERRRDADDDGLDAIALFWDNPGLRSDEALLVDPGSLEEV